MGKQRRKRTSFHSPAQETGSLQAPTNAPDMSMDSLNTIPLNYSVPDNLFANVNLNIGCLKQSLNDETASIKSFKSCKSSKSLQEAVTTKKDKLKLRKELLLQKIDALNQQKKEAALRHKRKKQVVIGDTNSLLDALPVVECIKTEGRKEPSKCPRGIQKATKRKKDTIKNIQIYKTISKNKNFIANPLQAITEHIRTVVEDEVMKQKIN